MLYIYGPVFENFGTGDADLYEFATLGTYFVSYLLMISFTLVYMLIADKKSLKVFTNGGFKKSIIAVLAGVGLGFCFNAFISLTVAATGSVTFSFNKFVWYMPFMFLLLSVPALAEEVLLRGYVPAFLEEKLDMSAVAFFSGVLFIPHHIENLKLYGFDTLFCLNVFLLGVFMYFLVKYTGNFWVCCGFHTAWNFTQMFLFGLPNSGLSSCIALFAGNDVKNNFFYNSVYGYEGSLFTTLLIGLAVVVMAWMLHKKNNSEVNA
jgi:hypothetical protein